VKFVRHLTAVVLAVAVIVGLGMLWAHVSGGGTGASHLGRAPSRVVILRLQQIKAVVITVSAAWRRHRRMRRTAVPGSG
jgi:hypothetical protein